MPRIAVIGAGIIGAAIAFRLAERGLDVVLLDRAEPGDGVTSTTYAWVNANEKLPRAYFDLNVAAMEEYRRLAWRLAPAYWYHASGSLSWYEGAAAAAALAARVQRLTGWDYAAELVPAATVMADLEPGLRGGLADSDTQLGRFPTEAWVDAVEMTRKLVESTRVAGGRVLTGPEREVVAIALERERVTAVELRGGQSLPITAVVNAAGNGGPAIAAMVGRTLPMAEAPGLIVHATLPDGADPLRVPIESDRFAVRPDGPGRVLLALGVEDATELAAIPPGNLALDHPLVTQLLAWGTALAPGLASALPVAAVVPLRPMPRDGYPSVGTVPRIGGYFEAITHSGVTLAPFLGRAITNMLLGRPPDPLLEPFRPDRPALA